MDKEETTTSENIANMKKILISQRIPLENLVVVNFAILSRSSYNSLITAGIDSIYVISANISFEENKTLLDYEDWIDAHYQKQKEFEEKITCQ